MSKLKRSLIDTAKFFILFLTFGFLFLTFNKVYAADFKTDYQVEYDLTQSTSGLTSKVKFSIKITNLRGSVYVNKYTIGFPKSFAISNLVASDDHGDISPRIINTNDSTNVEMEFSNPNVGTNSVNNFYLTLEQSNLFKANGNVWEVALPIIENKGEGSYRAIVNLPEGTDKKISIAKPRPTLIKGSQIIWDNPYDKTIYAVFGNSQIYNANLSYHLKNTEVYPIATEVAFPPDTLYQKIFVQSVNPEPDSIYQDEDGNYMGKYTLKPLETKTINFNSVIQVFPQPRPEMVPVIRADIETQSRYLLTQQKFWQIKSLDKIEPLKTARDIFDFDVNTLKYDYSKVVQNNTRLGAETALSRPDQAVCLEFADLFIAAAREKGIPSREVEGFGYSYDPQLQPLSLVSDVLHAWPEYYDEAAGIWIPVDPTWQNTSGIDFFTSFDLNHIVFAIHGKKSDYPLPAGMYKITDSKDIDVKTTTDIPEEKKSVTVENFDTPLKISDKKTYDGKLFVKNTGNVYLLNVPVEIKGANLDVSNGNSTILSLAPLESKEIDFKYISAVNNGKSEGVLTVNVLGQKQTEKSIGIIPTIYFFIGEVAGISIFLVCSFLLYKKIRSRRVN